MERHHPQTRVRAWVFTTQNTLPAFEGLCRGRFPSENNVTYAKWQRESGDRTHQDHIQGYVIFKNPVSKPSLCFASHWEPRKGSHTQADTYVEKVDTRVDGPWMVGIPPQQGARNDLATLKEDIDKGMPTEEIWNIHFTNMLRYRKGLSEYIGRRFQHVESTPKVTVIVGRTGVGKSKYANEKMPRAYWKFNGMWWDGYDGETEVIIDEFYGWIPYTTMLRLMDRYKYRVEYKGGSTNWNAKDIIITSNNCITQWYDWNKCKIEPFLRRITSFLYIEKTGIEIQTTDFERFKALCKTNN